MVFVLHVAPNERRINAKGREREKSKKGQTVVSFHVNELFFLISTVPASN